MNGVVVPGKTGKTIEIVLSEAPFEGLDIPGVDFHAHGLAYPLISKQNGSVRDTSIPVASAVEIRFAGAKYRINMKHESTVNYLERKLIVCQEEMSSS